jgi:hypothetical protein
MIEYAKIPFMTLTVLAPRVPTEAKLEHRIQQVVEHVTLVRGSIIS